MLKINYILISYIIKKIIKFNFNEANINKIILNLRKII